VSSGIEIPRPLISDGPITRWPDHPIDKTAGSQVCRPFLFPRGIMLGVLGGRTNDEWIAQYASSHQHPANRVCHTLGIPTILLSLPVFIASIFVHSLWIYGAALFLIGWLFQFIGHAFEGKAPEFFQDWRFLFVGVRWWWAKIHGKA
jgi:hypothetical protein